jgi:hypothetical protein
MLLRGLFEDLPPVCLQCGADLRIVAFITAGATGVRVQAPGERLAEITPGRASFQQGRAATCKDAGYKGRPETVRGLRSGA